MLVSPKLKVLRHSSTCLNAIQGFLRVQCLAQRLVAKVIDDRFVTPLGGVHLKLAVEEDLNADVDSLEPWYDSPHGEEPGSRKEEMHGHL